MSNTAAGQEFHIILILFLLIFTVLFCHSLIRLCMLALKKKDARRTTRLLNNGGYAHPEEPIQVMLARDEEMGLEDDVDDEEKDLPPPPPAYGLWRGSVVSDLFLFLVLAQSLIFSRSVLIRIYRDGNVPSLVLASQKLSMSDQRIGHQAMHQTIVLSESNAALNRKATQRIAQTQGRASSRGITTKYQKSTLGAGTETTNRYNKHA